MRHHCNDLGFSTSRFGTRRSKVQILRRCPLLFPSVLLESALRPFPIAGIAGMNKVTVTSAPEIATPFVAGDLHAEGVPAPARRTWIGCQCHVRLGSIHRGGRGPEIESSEHHGS